METGLIKSPSYYIGPRTLRSAVTPDPERPKDISIPQIWRIIRRQRIVILVSLTVALLGAAVYCIVAPRRYEATARVAISGENSNPLGIEMAEMASPLRDTSLVQETQVRILGSDAIAWDVIQQLRLDRVEELRGKALPPTDSLDHAAPSFRHAMLDAFHRRMRVRSLPKTQIVEVSFRSTDPKLAAEVANQVARAFVERNFRTRFNATMQASDWLTHQLDELKKVVESKQAEFVEYQKKTEIVGTDDPHNMIVSRLDELNKHLASSQADRILLEAKYRQSLNSDPGVIMEIAPSPMLQVLQTQQAELNSELAQLITKYGNSYPKIVQVRTQLAQIADSLHAEDKKIRQRLENDYRAAVRAENMASSEVERQKQEAYKLNQAGIQYLILKRELDGSRELYEDLQKKLKEAGIVAGLKSTNVNVVDAAEIPVVPVEPLIPLTVLIAVVLGGMCGICMAFAREAMDTTVNDPQLLEKLVDVPLLCVIPHMRTELTKPNSVRVEPSRVTKLPEPRSAFAEAFRILRSTLTLSQAGGPPRVMMVTSALPGDGKTVTATNIAFALAQGGHRVLLIDGDMRRSPLQARLGLQVKGGLSNCLASTLEPSDVVVHYPELPTLDVLAAGERPPYPAELLDSDRMRQLLRQWRENYDHIVIDTPPVLGLSDALVLATMSDVVLLIARNRVTGQQSLCRAKDALSTVGVRPLGIVFNDLDQNSGQHYDYYGYYGRTYSRYY